MQAAEGDAWQRVVQTDASAFLDAVTDPSVQRIISLDGPAVSGRDMSPDNSDASGLIVLRGAVELLMVKGWIEAQPLEPLCRLLFGALFEAGIYIASADDTEAAEREVSFVLERLFMGTRDRTRPGPARLQKARWLTRRPMEMERDECDKQPPAISPGRFAAPGSKSPDR